jgi:low affinity Fe/Cu permease
MNNCILEINENFDEIKTLFVELEENLSILTIGNLVCIDDIKDIQEIIVKLETKIKNGKQKINTIDIDKKKEIENIYHKYDYKVNKIKELFFKNFLYE